MAGKISARDIEALKARLNIADVVGEYVSLRTGGVGSLKGLCPFHDEKSPSFNVRPAQGFFHCFGCGEGGDVFKFVQKIENLAFTESVEKLAAKIGFVLTYEEGQSQDFGQKARIFEANALAAAFYESKLIGDEATIARELLKKRGFDESACSRFSVGYAPKGWQNLTDFLTSKGFTINELVLAGLVTSSERGAYDKFRGRLIWPIRDATSQVIGFGARKLYDDDNGPKYLNTADTLVYHKSQVLYGIDLAKRDISKTQKVVVVEGYTDVMACHLAGVTTAVATCGTAFGDDHIRIINRMLSGDPDAQAEVIFTFDPDAAGQKAALRAFADSHKFKAATFVAVGPDGLDPSDLRSLKGDEAVVRMIAARRPLFEFAIKQRLSKFDLDSLEGRVAAARSAAQIVASISDLALRNAYARELAGWTNLDSNEIAEFLKSAAKTSRTEAVDPIRITGTDSAITSQIETKSQNSAVNLADPLNKIERTTLEVLLQCPAVMPAAVVSKIVSAGFSAPAHAAIGRAIGQVLASEPRILESTNNEYLAAIQAELPSELHGLFRSIVATSLPVPDQETLLKYAEGVLVRALESVLSREKDQLLARLRRLDPERDRAEYRDVNTALMQLEMQKRSLR